MTLSQSPTISPTIIGLNAKAMALLQRAGNRLEYFGVTQKEYAEGSVWDFGIHSPGGIEAGILLGEICLAGLGQIGVLPPQVDAIPFPEVWVRSDHPVSACLLSQYAGWAIQPDNYFAMGSGPMRAAYAGEKVFEELSPGQRDNGSEIVGVLETNQLPAESVLQWIHAKVGGSAKVHLLAAPTKSLAGGVQIVARSLETAMHKLHAIHFPIASVLSGYGSAPLPTPAKGTLDAIGRTNDAILYGGRVVLWVRADDELIAELGPKVPSSASVMYGRPFAEILKEAGGDFYKVDPLLFSPAEVVFCNLASGRTFRFGKRDPSILLRSCGMTGF